MQEGPRSISRSLTWNGITSSSTLCDPYEIQSINQSIKGALNSHGSHNDTSVDNHPSMGLSTTHLSIQGQTPLIMRLSPLNGGSNLCDAYEFQAINQSIRRAVNGHPSHDEVSSTVDDHRSFHPPTAHLPIHAQTPSILRSSPSNDGSTLCNSHAIRAINQSLKRALCLCPSHNEVSSTVHNHPSSGPTTTSLQSPARTPSILRPSPRSGESTLLDSSEIRSLAHQLNRALQAQERGSPCLGYLASPFYVFGRRYMEHLQKESCKTPKRVTCGKIEGKGGDKGGKGGFVPRLWRKLKRSLFWRKK